MNTHTHAHTPHPPHREHPNTTRCLADTIQTVEFSYTPLKEKMMANFSHSTHVVTSSNVHNVQKVLQLDYLDEQVILGK